jgi:beta-phosphoglucomutase-like phosphatase (HAD superfamily)
MRTSADLVLFDCDGVLVDSEPIAVRIDVATLAELGVSLSESEVIQRFVGRSAEVMVAAIEEHLGHRLPEGWEEQAEERLRAATVVFDDVRTVPELLQALAAR